MKAYVFICSELRPFSIRCQDCLVIRSPGLRTYLLSHQLCAFFHVIDLPSNPTIPSIHMVPSTPSALSSNTHLGPTQCKMLYPCQGRARKEAMFQTKNGSGSFSHAGRWHNSGDTGITIPFLSRDKGAEKREGHVKSPPDLLCL